MRCSPSTLISWSCLLGLWTSVRCYSFDIVLAQTALRLSYAAYCSKAGLQDWSCFWCNSGALNSSNIVVHAVVQDAHTQTFGYVASDHTAKLHVISFRGTVSSSLKNWLLDLDAELVAPYPRTPAAKVHLGILKTYLSLRNSLVATVQAIGTMHPEYTWLVTGHSLGAAAAMLCGLDLVYNTSVLKRPPSVYTFGSPRVGNKEWATLFDQSLMGYSWRMVHEADPVPHLPPQNWLDHGWHHTSLEVWNRGYGLNVTMCDTSGEDPHCADSVKLPIRVDQHTQYLGIDGDTGNYQGCPQ